MGQACGHSLLCRTQQYQPAASDIRGQQVLLKAEESPARCSEALQDALLTLGSVIDIPRLQEAIKDAIAAVLPKVDNAFIYLLHAEGRLVCGDPLHELPQEGKLRDAVLLQKRIECSGLTPSELLGQQMSSLAAPLPPDKQVLILPLLDQDSGRVLAVFLMHCSPLSDADEQNLRTLEKHILVACKRVLAIQKLQPWTQVNVPTGSFESLPHRPESPKPQPWSQVNLYTGPPGTPPPQPENAKNDEYDDLDRQILQLCGELYDLDAASLQIKVLQYLEKQTQSPCCCLLLVSEDSHQLFCQVVGNKELEEEISFPRFTPPSAQKSDGHVGRRLRRLVYSERRGAEDTVPKDTHERDSGKVLLQSV